MDVPACPGCRQHDARIAELEARVLALKRQVRDLLDRLKPPPPPRPASAHPPAPAKTPTGKKPGAQPGHPPHLKVLLPPERITRFVRFVPARCRSGRTPLPAAAGPSDPAPTRHPVAELPTLAAAVTEYQGHARTCPGCGTVTTAALPAAVRAASLGPRLTATLSYFAGAHGVSKRGVEEIAEAVFDVPIALGTVAHLEGEVGEGAGGGPSGGAGGRGGGPGQAPGEGRRVARFCARVLDGSPALWLFVTQEGVEPTNHHAERVQRRAVSWRRKSFGCHSVSGCRFVERILTVVGTLRLQQRPLLAYLCASIEAYRAGQPSPRLLPVG